MGHSVWKFVLDTYTVLSAPAAAKVALVGLDPATGNPAIWLEIDHNMPKVDRRFAIYGTGYTFEVDSGHSAPLHVGSVIQEPYVWHVYEVRS